MKKFIITLVIAFLASIVIGAVPTYLFYAPSQLEMSELFPLAVRPMPEMSFILPGTLALFILWILSFDKMGINNFKSGAITGLWYGILIFTFFDFTLLGLTKLYSLEFALTDILMSGVIGILQGGVIGWSLGRFS